MGNHTEEWSAREQRIDFIHPLGHRTRTLKEGGREILSVYIAAINVKGNSMFPLTEYHNMSMFEPRCLSSEA